MFLKQKIFIPLLGPLAVAALTSACAGNPATGGADLVLMTEGKEISIGEEMHEKMMAEGSSYDDPALQAYIDRVGQRLVANSDRPKLKFTFTVIDSPDINAFATPGGFVYINRGLLAYLESEAELAGVLAHEIGHITARHAARQQTANVSNQVMATTVGILTGSRDLYDASTMYGTELVRGYGRDHELEADGLGAEYMYKSGYDPDALLEVIGVLKDQEQFQRVKAKSTGKKVATYHGLYATHPRNDQRLQTVIRTAGELELEEGVDNPEVPGEFRRRVNGLVWGPIVQGLDNDNRYYHKKLGFTFEHPPGWTVDASSKAIVARAPDSSASLTVTVRRQDRAATPKSVLEGSASGTLSIGQELEQAGLAGYSAVASNGSVARRLAVIDYNGLSYLFQGEAGDFPAADPQLLAIIESFRPMHPKERSVGTPQHVQYIQVPRGATMASLAASSRIPDAEAQLRLLNGFYPRGEPRTGDWVKIIK